ncbi:MAG: glycosyltransferase [Rhizobacter sp.]|nr:glycosyltransferase [Chlorobiales bacterium]
MFELLCLSLHFISLCFIFIVSTGQLILAVHYLRRKKTSSLHHALLIPDVTPDAPDTRPFVTVQLPVYNERYVVERLLNAVARFHYPKHRFEIQVLDDSTDDTTSRIAATIEALQPLGLSIHHLHRARREGFKAGALQHGLRTAKGEFIAIFDADFVPSPDFLEQTLPCFERSGINASGIGASIGMVQVRWDHLNRNESLLTRLQAFGLDAHFSTEQSGRNAAGAYINFNGTAGVWRKACIDDAGGWQSDTLTEDLDLSYRAQLRGWQFTFLEDVSAPALLPAEMSAYRSQQSRWVQGAIETARKHLRRVWSQPLPLPLKLHATQHLCANVIYFFILLSSLLGLPLMIIKASGAYPVYFNLTAGFALSFLGSMLFYAAVFFHRDVSRRWQTHHPAAVHPATDHTTISAAAFGHESGLRWLTNFAMLYPAFIAFSSGMALHNSVAVARGLAGKKMPFVRTPKVSKGERHGNLYLAQRLSRVVIVEALLAAYFLGGAVVSIVLGEVSLLPFQLMLFLGFAMVSGISVQQHFETARGAKGLNAVS